MHFETTATEITQTGYSTKTSQHNEVYFKNKHPKQQVI